jgi:hypothetical protein
VNENFQALDTDIEAANAAIEQLRTDLEQISLTPGATGATGALAHWRTGAQGDAGPQDY